MKKFFKTYRITNKNSTFIQKIKYIIILAVMIISANTFGQDDCNSAIHLQDEDLQSTYSGKRELWFSSNSYSDTMIFIFSTNYNQNVFINTIVIYKGDCDNLELYNSVDLTNPDSVYILRLFDYDPNSNYYFQIFLSDDLNNDFSVSSTIPPGAPCPQPTGCGLVKNYSFEDYYQMIDYIYAFENNEVCYWQRAWGTPSFSGMGANANGAFMWATINNAYPYYNTMEAIFQDGMNVIQPGVQYDISYNYYTNGDALTINVGLTNYQLPNPTSSLALVEPIPNGFTMQNIGNHNTGSMPINSWQQVSSTFSISSTYDNLVIYPYSPSSYTNTYQTPYIIIDNIIIKPKLIFVNLQSPQTISCAQSITIQPYIPTINNSFLLWSWTSNQTGNTVIGTTINLTVNPLVTTTYTVKATDANGCEWKGSFTVNVVPFQPLPLNINAAWIPDCRDGVTLSFNMPSSPAITSAIWTLPNNAVIINNNSINSIYVKWNNAGIATVSVQAYSSNGCLVYQGSVLVNPNLQTGCIGAYSINNTNATQIKTMTGLVSGNIASSSAQVTINGIITINENLEFNNCTNVKLGVNAKIIVMPGCTLTIKNSNFTACECNWEGIYVENSSAKLIIENSFFSGAKNAVVSSYDGKISLYNTTFSNNQLSVWIRRYNPESIDIFGNPVIPTPHNAYIGKCKFEKTALYISNSNPIGIKIDTVYNVCIGDVTLANNQNEFYKMAKSIISTASDVNIFNNYFNESFYYASGNDPIINSDYEPEDVAIFIKRPYDPNPPQQNNYAIQNKVNIGGTASNQSNIFNTQNVGIYGFDTQVHIKNNTFSNQRFTAIHLKDLYNSDINNNSITMENNFMAINNLYNSSILTENSLASAYVKLNINNNTINNTRTGINTRNCNGDNGYYYANIKNNIINFNTVTPTSNNRYFGISASNCNFAVIESNSMVYGTNPPSSFHEGLYGIYLSSTTNAKVSLNRSGRVGDGIYIAGSSSGSQYFCNDLDKCWYGFYFNNATLSHQLLNPFGNNTTSDNYWYDIPPVTNTTALRRMEGLMATGNQINWRHRALTNDINNTYSPYIVSLSDPLYQSISPIQNQSANTNCFAWFVLSNVASRDALLGNIVTNSMNYQLLPDENEYMGKEYAYKELDNNPASLMMFVPEDTTYQNFYTTTKQGNIGKNDEVCKAINARDYSTAINQNNAIVPQNAIENNRKTIHGIYLQTLINNDTLSVSDSITLMTIAMQTPFTGGDAVYSARVILGIDPLQYNLDYAKPPVRQILNDTKAKAKVYPNPACDQLSVELSTTTEGIASIEIYDLNGKLCYQTHINASQQLQTIDIGSIKKGIYNIRITANNLSEYQKLVIIK